MEQYIWHIGTLPPGAQFARVHGVLVLPDGRFLLRYKEGEARVTGGHIDPGDENIEAALKREVAEEINCQLDRCDYIGYVEMIKPQTGVHEFWARMVARVSEIGPAQADPDREHDWIYGRSAVPLAEAQRELEGTFPTNRESLAAAWQMAQAQGYFTAPRSEHIEIINRESRDGKTRWED